MTNTSLRDAILLVLRATADLPKDQILARVRRVDGHAVTTHALLGRALREMLEAGQIKAEAPPGTWISFRYSIAASPAPEPR